MPGGPSLTQDPCWEAGWKTVLSPIHHPPRAQPSETSAARFDFGVSTKTVGTIKAGAQWLHRRPDGSRDDSHT